MRNGLFNQARNCNGDDRHVRHHETETGVNGNRQSKVGGVQEAQRPRPADVKVKLI